MQIPVLLNVHVEKLNIDDASDPKHDTMTRAKWCTWKYYMLENAIHSQVHIFIMFSLIVQTTYFLQILPLEGVLQVCWEARRNRRCGQKYQNHPS